MRFLSICFALLTAWSVHADELIPPAEFETMSLGKTMYFSQGGEYYGAEQYFPNRLVTWKNADGTCESGFWHGEGDQICFTYKEQTGTQCWHFIRKESGFAARAIGNPPELDLQLETVDTTKLLCEAPLLGVKAER